MVQKNNIALSSKRNYWREGRYLGFVAVLVYFIGWFLITREGFGIVRPIMLPSPLMVINAAIRIRDFIFWDILATVLRVIAGLLTGMVLGVGFGLLMSFFKKVHNFFNPLVEGMRPVPVIAMIPFFLMWFGITEPGKFLLVVLGVFNLVIINTIEAVKNVPSIYISAAQTLGASKKQIFQRIIIPAIIPELIGPIRVATALSFTLVVAAEYMGAQAGLGFRILDARLLFNTDVLFLGVVLFGILAASLDMIIRRIIRYAVRWSERTEK